MLRDRPPFRRVFALSQGLLFASLYSLYFKILLILVTVSSDFLGASPPLLPAAAGAPPSAAGPRPIWCAPVCSRAGQLARVSRRASVLLS